MTLDIRIAYIVAGVLFSSSAQVFLKLATRYQDAHVQWYGLIFSSAMSYLVSFVMYYFALKAFPISKVSPVMTVGVVVLVVLFGVLTGEMLSVRQTLGIIFGVFSILLILI
ncbi:MAG: EamA family transporter [Desulfobacterales bacterium]|nr:EamA family transporter [Desulfobacterales bacterium]